MVRFASTFEGRMLLVLLAACAFVFVALAPHLRFNFDLDIYHVWGIWIVKHPLHVYSYGSQVNAGIWYRPEYPPGTMYLFGLVEGVYWAIQIALGMQPSACMCSGLEVTVLKLPAILAHLATVAIIYQVARRAASFRVALVAAATYAFAPVVIMDALLWGQTDDITLLCIVVAFILAIRGRGAWSGIALGVAVMLKPQPAIFIPLALVYLLRTVGWRPAVRACAGLAGSIFVLWLPYLLPPRPEILVWRQEAAAVLTFTQNVASRTGFNIWWLLGAQTHDVGTAYLGPFSPEVLGTALFVALVLVAVWSIWRHPTPARLWAAGAVVGFGFFDLWVLQYERYAFPAVALFLLAAIYDRRYWLCYAVLSITIPLNMLFSMLYSHDIDHNPLFTPLPLGHAAVQLILAQGTQWAVSLVNVAALAVAIVMMVLPPRAAARRAPATAGSARAPALPPQNRPASVGAGHTMLGGETMPIVPADLSAAP